MLNKVLTVDHIGIAVRSLESALERYANFLGFLEQGISSKSFTLSPTVELKDAGLKICMISGASAPSLEFLAPLNKESVIDNFLTKRGEGLHHICYRVSNIEGALNQLKKNGYKLIDKAPRPGVFHKKIAFIYPKDLNGVLIELCEE